MKKFGPSTLAYLPLDAVQRLDTQTIRYIQIKRHDYIYIYPHFQLQFKALQRKCSEVLQERQRHSALISKINHLKNRWQLKKWQIGFESRQIRSGCVGILRAIFTE